MSRRFRQSVWQGVAVLLPAVLTVVALFWIWGTVDRYLFAPLTSGARSLLVFALTDVRDEAAARGGDFVRVNGGHYVPREVHEYVRNQSAGAAVPNSGLGVYQRYVDLRFMRPYYVLPALLVLFVLATYLLGRLMAHGAGTMIWEGLERLIRRVPLVRSVYTAAKKVTELFFSETSVRYRHAVAVEYPRRGVWTLGFVTGDGMRDLRSVSGAELLTVLMDTSPVPMNGFTSVVRKRETLELNMTGEQAIEFVISCGVATPRTAE